MPRMKKRSVKQKQLADRLRKQTQVHTESHECDEGRQICKAVPSKSSIQHETTQLQQVHTESHECDEGRQICKAVPSKSSIQHETTQLQQVAIANPCSSEYFVQLIGDTNTEISDDIITASLNLINAHCTADTNLSVGLYTPAQFHLLSTGLITLPPPPPNKDIINIHPVNRHWVCSFYKASSQELFVYDSSQSSVHLENVKVQLKGIYPQSIVNQIKYVSVTQQGSEPICGIMAIAYALSCFLGEDPTKIRYNIKTARDHLKHCLCSGQILKFPVQQNTSSLQWINAYMCDQQNRSNLYHHSNVMFDKPGSIFHNISSTLQKGKAKENSDIHLMQMAPDKHDYLKSRTYDTAYKRKMRADPVKRQRQRTIDSASKRKIRADPVERQKHKQSDRNLKKTVRADPVNSQTQRIIDSASKRKIRADPVERQKHKQSDRNLKKTVRADPVNSQRQRIIDSASKRKIRADPVERQKHKQSDRNLKKTVRADPVNSQRQRTIDSASKRKIRADPAERQKHKQSDRNLKKTVRADPVNSQRQRTIDSASKRKIRADPVERQKHRQSDRNLKKTVRADPVNSQRQRTIDSASKRKIRADPVERQKHKQSDRNLKKTVRADPVNSQRQRTIDSASKRKIRTDPVKRQKHQYNDNQQKKKKRADPNASQKLKAVDKNSKQKARTITSVQLAIQKFRKNCSEMPVYVCCVCFRLLFRKQVKCFDILKFPNIEQILRCIIVNNFHKPQSNCDKECVLCPKWICFTCSQHLSRRHIPNQASLNHLHLDELPACIKDLNNLEKHLVSPIIPFMKIVSLPKGSQKGIHGPVVCVPSNIPTTVHTLPRPFTDNTIITVKLKRKLQYRGHHLHQQVSVNRVHEALLYLKRKSPHFSAIDINLGNVTSTTEPIFVTDNAGVAITEQPMAQDVSTPADCSKETSEPGTHPPKATSHPPVHVADDTLASTTSASTLETLSKNAETQNPEDPEDLDQDIHETSAPMVSCLEPEDMSQVIGTEKVTDSVFCIAPGQGSLPVTVFNMESQAFPYLFPSSKNTFSESRNTKLGLNRYFNSRLFSADLRFASDPQYIFYSQYLSELNTINSSVSIAMRKGNAGVFDQQHVTAGDLRDPDKRKNILSSDKGYHFLSTARGSPPYWEKTLKDLFAMVKQLGIPTWFCSFSAADRRWPEIVTAISKQQGRPVPADLDWSTYTQIINSNPVTACRMFQNRVLSFFTDLILSEAEPIGQVEDFFYRTEFQSRGWPHIHCLLWCADAPKFDPNDDNKDFLNYIDKYITCNFPDQTTDPELYDIVTSVQMHSKRHSRTCKKGNKDCRFGFPRPVSIETFIASPTEPPDNIPLATYKKTATDTLSAVWDSIKACQEQEQDDEITVTEMFQAINITHNQYKTAHSALAKKHTVIYKRNIQECWVNPYNKHLLEAWNGNMDIQPVLDAYSCIMYIVSYISKAERELGDLLRNAQKEAKEGHMQPIQELRKLGNVYLNSREVCVMEAVYRVTGMHLKQSSRQVVFIPADRNAPKISKPLKVLKEEDDNIWMTGLIDRYLARPASTDFEQMCLAQFARDYSIKERSNTETHESLEQLDTDTPPSKVFTLQDNLGKIAKRNRPAVIRYMKVNKDRNSEDYYHNLLRLYFPHRSKELQPINADTYEQMFQQQSALILPLISQFEKLSQDLDEAWKSLQEHGYPEDAWADVAPNQEPSRLEEQEELQNALRLFRQNAKEIPEEDIPDFSPNQTSSTTTNHTPTNHIISSNALLEQRNRLKNMNHQQAQIFHFIRIWAQKKETGEHVKPFHIFLTGGAGTGKSFTIKCIYHEISRILTRPTGNPDLPVALLVSYTGTAAYNIGGQTIHSAFSINRGMSKVLPEESANTLRSNLQDLQLLIIDEVSMVPPDLLELIHCRLQQIKQPSSSTASFGNVSILAVGDFYQIPPVAKKSLLSNNTALTDLWNMFYIWELTEVVRQKGDNDFIALLNRLRVRKKREAINANDEQFLKDHVISKSDPSYPEDALHIAPLHRHLREHNQFMLTKMSRTEILHTIEAADMCQESKTQKNYKRNQPLDSKDTNLPAIITICRGAKVMLTMNIDVTDGLTNGAMGTITSILTHRSPLGLPDAICILFQDQNIGKNSRTVRKPPPYVDSLSTVILPQTGVIQRKPFQVTRHQYPLMLSWAVTTHKIQGATTNEAVVSLDGAFKPGMAYVALSRVTSSSGLHLLKDHYNTDAIYCNESVKDKLSCMPKSNTLPSWNAMMPKGEFNHQQYMYIASHNCEGLLPHLQDLTSSLLLKHMDMIALQETWLKPDLSFTNPFPDYNQFLLHRQEHQEKGIYSKGGVALYIHQDFACRQLNTNDISIECLAVLLPDVSTTIYCVYKPPKTPLRHFTSQLARVLQRTDSIRSIVVGDFNIDTLKTSHNELDRCLQNYSQIIREPTTGQRTCLDHIYIKNINCHDSGVFPTHFSYHDMTYAVFSIPDPANRAVSPSVGPL